MRKILFNNHQIKEMEQLPKDWNKIEIKTKKGKVFEFVRHEYVKHKLWDSINQTYCLYGRFRMKGTDIEKPFIFIRIELDHLRGWIVSDQIHNHAPNVHLINLYRRLKGKEEIHAEKDTFNDIEPILRNIFKSTHYSIERHPQLNESRKIRIGHERTQTDWNVRFGEERQPKNIIPDFVGYELKRANKEFFIEVERKSRNEKEIKMKYWKLIYLDKKVYYIFENEEVQEHYLEILYQFQQEIPEGGKRRRFKSFNYTTKEELYSLSKPNQFHKLTNR